ncbi:MAG: bifunctional glutamate N-acetyltransferase/amino-acid acetyltransferase ArgJ, partial [Rhizobiales bacterium]|nr:bifunctional glutamate N-acetyltransferase/amino-acid acetyltransferase ArgJ [Hyphomicrobiales bacterium]
RGTARALLVNSGNANAFTGRAGELSCAAMAAAVAEHVGCRIDGVMLASTGVIGEALDPAPVLTNIAGLAQTAGPGGWQDAASAIMTTDTFAKYATRTARIDDVDVRINAIAKGSGMIAPDMATMLGFVFTDAHISPQALQRCLSRAVDQSFNAVTVDGDTSTSDTVLAFATGRAGHAQVHEPSDKRLRDFQRALSELLTELAHLIVRDGEGASKFVTVRVEGARSKRSARKIGLSIANSPLVKTAIAGEDANWGRVVMAVGKAGEPASRDRLAIWFGPTRVAVKGEIDPDYREPEVAAYMKGEEIEIRVDVGIGRGRDTVWTCDLTERYIAINADYRT